MTAHDTSIRAQADFMQLVGLDSKSPMIYPEELRSQARYRDPPISRDEFHGTCGVASGTYGQLCAGSRGVTLPLAATYIKGLITLFPELAGAELRLYAGLQHRREQWLQRHLATHRALAKSNAATVMRMLGKSEPGEVERVIPAGVAPDGYPLTETPDEQLDL